MLQLACHNVTLACYYVENPYPDLPQKAPENQNKYSDLSEVNDLLKNKLERNEVEIKAFKEIIETLENKVEHAEASLIKHFNETKNLAANYEKEKVDSKVLRDVIKNHNGEMLKIRGEIRVMAKAQKAKEKEIYNLESKSFNQQEVNRKLKEEVSNLKREKLRNEKAAKKMVTNMRKDKNQNISIPIKASKVDVSTSTDIIDMLVENNLSYKTSAISNTPCTISIGMDKLTENMSPNSDCSTIVTSVPVANLEIAMNRTIKTTSELPHNCHHSPQCTLRQPNPPPPFAPISFEQFYHPEKPPKHIYLLPSRTLAYSEFRELQLKGEHECEECSPGMLYHEYTERVEYSDPGPCGGTSAQYLRICPNSQRATISVHSWEMEKSEKKFKAQSFKCNICNRVFGKAGLLCFHTNQTHRRK